MAKTCVCHLILAVPTVRKQGQGNKGFLMSSDFSSNAQNIARLKTFLVGVKKLKPLGVLSVIIENLPAITKKQFLFLRTSVCFYLVVSVMITK